MTSCVDGSCDHEDDGDCVLALCDEVEQLRSEIDWAYLAGQEEMRDRVDMLVLRLGGQLMELGDCVQLLEAIRALPVHNGNEVSDG